MWGGVIASVPLFDGAGLRRVVFITLPPAVVRATFHVNGAFRFCPITSPPPPLPLGMNSFYIKKYIPRYEICWISRHVAFMVGIHFSRVLEIKVDKVMSLLSLILLRPKDKVSRPGHHLYKLVQYPINSIKICMIPEKVDVLNFHFYEKFVSTRL